MSAPTGCATARPGAPGGRGPTSSPTRTGHDARERPRVVVAPMPRLPIVTVLALVDAGATRDAPGTRGRGAPHRAHAARGHRTARRGRAHRPPRGARHHADRDGGLGFSASLRFTVDDVAALDAVFALFADVLRTPTFPAADVARRRDERLAEHRAGARRAARPRRRAVLRIPLRARRAVRAGARWHAALGAGARRRHRAALPRVRTMRRRAPRSTSSGTSRRSVRVSSPSARSANGASPASPGGPSARVAAQRRATHRAGGQEGRTADGAARGTRRRAAHASRPSGDRRDERDPRRPLLVAHQPQPARDGTPSPTARPRRFDWRRDAGPFVVSTAVKTEVTERAVEEILREIDGMRAAPPTAGRRWNSPTEYLAGVFPIRYETTAAVAGALAAATLFELPADWFSGYRHACARSRPSIVHAAARAHLDPSRLLALAVGDAAADRGTARAARGRRDGDPHQPTSDPSEDAMSRERPDASTASACGSIGSSTHTWTACASPTARRGSRC